MRVAQSCRACPVGGCATVVARPVHQVAIPVQRGEGVPNAPRSSLKLRLDVDASDAVVPAPPPQFRGRTHATGAKLKTTARIVRKIESLMARTGVNQVQLARQAEVPVTTLNRLMLSQNRGASIASSYSPTPDLLEKIAKALGVTVGTLISESERGLHEPVVSANAFTLARDIGRLVEDFAQVEPVDHFHHEARQVILRQPLVYRRRQQVGSVSINGDEATHWRAGLDCSAYIVSGHFNEWKCRKPDSLLDVVRGAARRRARGHEATPADSRACVWHAQGKSSLQLWTRISACTTRRGSRAHSASAAPPSTAAAWA